MNLRKLSPKRILISGSVIAIAAAVAITATSSFFADEETSTDNIFAAGAIDLQIDNESYVTNPEGNLVFSTSTSWDLTDLTDEKFFDFSDLKPGDVGEDTISIHVDNNDAWVCMDWTITERNENEITEPEDEDGDVTADEGELQNFINFVWWPDDGDNVLETDEAPNAIFTGSLEEMDGLSVAIADSSDDSINDGPITGDVTEYIGKAWCFGELTLNPLAQGSDTSPLDRGTGVECNGEETDNTSQTDSVVGDLSFRAVQSRNNDEFICGKNGRTTLTVEKVVINDNQGTSTTTQFSFTIDGGSPIQFEGDGNNTMDVAPDSYVVAEVVDAGYDSVISGDCDTNGNVTLAEGDHKTCTITNDDIGDGLKIGALLSAYVEPTVCDVNATTTIQLAIDSAVAGNTVCVDNGTFNENVDINKDITLAGSGATSTSEIIGNVTISADGATLEGFEINGNVSSTFHGLTIQYNAVLPLAGGNGILIGGTSGTASTIKHNVVTTAALTSPNNRGIYIDQNGTIGFVVENNTVTARKSGFGDQGTSGTVKFNVFNGYDVAPGVGWEVFHDSGETAPVIDTNNFNESPGIGVANLGDTTFDAPNNWWGDASSAGNTSGLVTTSNDQAAAYLEN